MSLIPKIRYQLAWDTTQKMVGAQNKLSPFSSCFPIFHLHSSALICGKNFFFPFFSFVLLFQPAKLLPFFNPIASCNIFFALQYS